MSNRPLPERRGFEPGWERKYPVKTIGENLCAGAARKIPRHRRGIVPALAAALLLTLGMTGLSRGAVVTQLHSPAVALTFDCCETQTPSWFDHSILDYLLAEKIPFTLFVSGNFARRNAEELRALAHLDAVEIENHSMHHILHMEKLTDREVVQEVRESEDLLFEITGKRTECFRFPGGNYDDRVLRDVENLHYRVVHWSFASGDPDPKITPEALTRWVLLKAHPGSILIFHINGRGYSTGKALPGIVEALRKRGYHFTKLEDALSSGTHIAAAHGGH
jgi:peptidoglycan-N-acetylglucosamine deacetylase